MSLISQLSESNPNFAWIAGSMPLAVALDLAIGDLPGRTQAMKGLSWMTEMIDGSVQATVKRVGGGRGGDLFGGFLLTTMVVGISASVVWLVVDLGDTIGGVASLVVRTGVIAAGLVIRPAGDRIRHAAEAVDPREAARLLRSLDRQFSAKFSPGGRHQLCVAAVAEWTSSAIVVPLFWLGVGGPAAMWGYVALRSLGQIQESLDLRGSLTSRVPRMTVHLAEWLPARFCWVLLCLSAWIIRANSLDAWRMGRRAALANPNSAVCWSQGAMAGALGVSFSGGRVFVPDRSDSPPLVGSSTRSPDERTVVLAIRLMQVTTLLAAGIVALSTLLR